MNTDGLRAIRDGAKDEGLAAKIKGFIEGGKVLTEVQVADILWKAMDKGSFESGSTLNALDSRSMLRL